MEELKLIVMLTQHDQTVKNAIETFESCKDLPVQDWGFKNIGIPVDEMKRLVSLMKQAGKTTYMEVVTYDEEDCLAATKLAIECDFDYLMGTVYYKSVYEMLAAAGKKYMPFCGHVWDNPSILGDTCEGIIKSAKELQALGCYGTDILAYRFVGDPEELLEKFMKEVDFNVVIAGSISSFERVDNMLRLKPQGFTIGSALFEKKFVPDGDFRANLKAVADYLKSKQS